MATDDRNSKGNGVARRCFLKVVGAAPIGVGVLACADDEARTAFVPQERRLAFDDYPDLRDVGNTVTLDIGTSHPIGITRVAVDEFSVVSTRCTHEGCEVARSDSGWACPCHGATYTLTGSVTGGPAPRGLTTYAWELEDDALLLPAS